VRADGRDAAELRVDGRPARARALRPSDRPRAARARLAPSRRCALPFRAFRRAARECALSARSERGGLHGAAGLRADRHLLDARLLAAARAGADAEPHGGAGVEGGMTARPAKIAVAANV